MTKPQFDLSQLSEGISNMPRRLSRRERLADHLFRYLQITAHFGFIAGAIIGYAAGGWRVSLAAVIGCLVLGILMRRSLGLRGRDPCLGFYQRMRERAAGSRPGLLEWTIESLRGNKFTRAKCEAITRAYNIARADLRVAKSPRQQDAILARLDSETKRISYSG